MSGRTPDEIDRVNAGFYERIQYPWPPAFLERIDDPGFWARALDQEVGRSAAPVLADSGARIWVAGCGTNQALITALKYPAAQVLGSDLSAVSLALCRRNAESLGVANLELRRESINQVTYRECFDYVICTGVIHHNADPAMPLASLARALALRGVLELMVYNQYHRIMPAAFQQAVRELQQGEAGNHDYEVELGIARALQRETLPGGLMSRYLGGFADAPDAHFADSLIQPVEFAFTVRSLAELLAGAGLRIVTPCCAPFDAARGAVDWEMQLRDAELASRYDGLPDVARWQITNLLLLEASPMLWFYVERVDCGLPQRTSRELGELFLRSRFQRNETRKHIYRAVPDGSYDAGSPIEIAFPGAPRDPAIRKVFDSLVEGRPLVETLERTSVDHRFPRLGWLRTMLASSAFPFLRAVS